MQDATQQAVRSVLYRHTDNYMAKVLHACQEQFVLLKCWIIAKVLPDCLSVDVKEALHKISVFLTAYEWVLIMQQLPL